VGKKAFASKGKSIIKWEEVIPYLTKVEYRREDLTVILFRRVISTKEERFNPLVYLYFKPFPENIVILVNNEVEAQKVVDYIKNLLNRFNKNVDIIF